MKNALPYTEFWPKSPFWGQVGPLEKLYYSVIECSSFYYAQPDTPVKSNVVSLPNLTLAGLPNIILTGLPNIKLAGLSNLTLAGLPNLTISSSSSSRGPNAFR